VLPSGLKEGAASPIRRPPDVAIPSVSSGKTRDAGQNRRGAA
jgi:hypothetical protein